MMIARASLAANMTPVMVGKLNSAVRSAAITTMTQTVRTAIHGIFKEDNNANNP